MTKRTIIFLILWLVLGAVVFYSALMLLLYFNLFSWRYHIDITFYVLVFVVIFSLISCFILAKYTVGKIEIWFSFLIVLGLMVCGIAILYVFYTETVSAGFLSRRVLSPHWFRLSIFSIYLIPIISWMFYPYKYIRELCTTSAKSKK